jgi:hypothetical protein
MPFAIDIANLKEGLHHSGCPVCRLGYQAAASSIDSFLWENVNEPDVRQPIIDAYGFCAQHTRMLVATEMRNTGPVLGVNIIYEHLGRLVSRELNDLSLPGQPSNGVEAFLKRLGGSDSQRTAQLLQPKGDCPVCAQVTRSDLTTLETLLEMLARPDMDMSALYMDSDGLCLKHLRLGLEQFAARYPQPARWLCDETAARLERLSAEMREFIRKNNWEYREEKLSEAESLAWRRMLTFFTGQPGENFNFNLDTF